LNKNIKVAAAIIIKEGRFFATQRGYGAWKDWWEFPGGKVEAGESSEEALVREIKEELDTLVSVDEFVTTVEYDYPEFHISMDCFICSVISGELKLLEHESAKWLPLSDPWQVKWLPSDIEVIKKLTERSEQQGHES
jgi:8-oxo-dGTP diphosphatase